MAFYYCELCESFFGEAECVTKDTTFTIHTCYQRSIMWKRLKNRTNAIAAARKKKLPPELKFDPDSMFFKLGPEHDYLFVHPYEAPPKIQATILPLSMDKPPAYSAALLTSAPLTNPLTYGGGLCLMCQKSSSHTISESQITRNAAILVHQFLRDVKNMNVQGKGFMIGVAHKQGTTELYVALSGTKTTATWFRALSCKYFGFEVTGWTVIAYDKEKGVPIDASRAGKAIPENVQAFSAVALGDDEENTRDTGVCAASKIVLSFIRTDSLTKWNMTELAIGQFNSNKYDDGEPAVSCKGCTDFLPCLLCTSDYVKSKA
jgi:hypothetical protein